MDNKLLKSLVQDADYAIDEIFDIAINSDDCKAEYLNEQYKSVERLMNYLAEYLGE